MLIVIENALKSAQVWKSSIDGLAECTLESLNDFGKFELSELLASLVTSSRTI